MAKSKSNNKRIRADLGLDSNLPLAVDSPIDAGAVVGLGSSFTPVSVPHRRCYPVETDCHA